MPHRPLRDVPMGHPVATRDPVTEHFRVRRIRRVQVLAAVAAHRRRRKAIRARGRTGRSFA